MRKLLVLGTLAALLLVVGPMLVASAEEGARKHATAPAAAEGGHVRTPPPPIVLTPEQEAQLAAEIAAFNDALAKLTAKANGLLGPQTGPRYVREFVNKAIQPVPTENKRHKNAK
jgi:hypothetical protein